VSQIERLPTPTHLVTLNRLRMPTQDTNKKKRPQKDISSSSRSTLVGGLSLIQSLWKEKMPFTRYKIPVELV
jgi:hypothetical protein